MKGKLNIQKTKRGFAGSIEFTKPNGKPGKLFITVHRFNDDKLNGKDCEFKRDGGKLTEITVEGKTVYKAPEQAQTVQKTAGGKSKNQTYTPPVPDSFRADKTCIPKDTRELLEQAGIGNFYLKWNRLPRDKGQRDGKNPFEFYKRGRGYKAESFDVKPNFGKISFAQLTDRQNQLAKSLVIDVFSKEFTTDGRLITGLGNESVYEISIKLHHIYGIPYIPASSVKGALRSYIILNYFGEDAAPVEEKLFPFVNAEYRALGDKDFCEVFGAPAKRTKVLFKDNMPEKDNKGKYIKSNPETTLTSSGKAEIGKVIFFDAFPNSEPKMEYDIMNPHYPEYYSGSKPPTDYQNPVPIPFLTVAKTTFGFNFGSPLRDLNNISIKGKGIKELFAEALTHHGIGAKTAVGYGRMKEV